MEKAGETSLSLSSFLTAWNLYTQLNSVLHLHDNRTALLANPSQLSAIKSFLESHNYPGASESEINLSHAVANAFADFFSETGETALELWDVPDSSDPLWEIFKEQLLEVVKEAIADFVPGGTLATVGPILYNNLQEGNWMDAMYNAVDIVLNEADVFFPAANVISTGLKLATKGKQLKKVYDALKNAKALGEDYLLKLYNVLRNRIGWGISTIRDNFTWLGPSVGAKLDNVSSSTVFQKLKQEFDVTNSSPVFFDFQNRPVFKISTISQANTSIFMVLYPDSASGYNYTIGFYLGPSNATEFNQLQAKFKIRFDD
jgi:hypothetical protein